MKSSCIERVLQFGVVTLCALISLFLLSPALYLLLYLLGTKFWWLTVLYGLWRYWDRHSSERGGHHFSQFIRNFSLWYHFENYFPAKVAFVGKNYDLDSNRNYLFCCFPHGVVPIGTTVAFLFKTSQFYHRYSKFRVYHAAANILLVLPFLRELCLSLGIISCTSKSLNYVLSSEKRGQIVCLHPGGIEESFYSNPGIYKIVLKNRKGFVRIALMNGVPLVPVISFGENDTFFQISNPWIENIQNALKRIIGFAPILYYSEYGITPRKTPLTLLLGKPIEVQKVETPTEKQIDKLHKRFTEELVELFEKNKHKYIQNYESTYLEIQ